MSVQVDGGRIVAIGDDPLGDPATSREVIDARKSLLSPPFVEPHVHLDTALTAGQPRWNASGTLWEGIACWAERRREVTREDVLGRAEQVVGWQVANGVLHVRSHVDVTDPDLAGLDALLELRDRVRDVVGLQLVAFPQEGICSSPGGEARMREAVRRGVDVVGAIPHFEDTREDGVRSVEWAVALAEEAGLLVDAHCDEIDDDQSRFVEVLATRALRTGLRHRVTASHTTAMGSYNGAYSYKLRSGLTQVKELLAAGINVAFGHDDVMDPWFPMGAANPLQVAHVAAQLTGRAEIEECFRSVTDRAAAALDLGDRYGIGVGRPASFVLLPAADPFDVVRRQVRPTHVVANGRLVAEPVPKPPRPPASPSRPPATLSAGAGPGVPVQSPRCSGTRPGLRGRWTSPPSTTPSNLSLWRRGGSPCAGSAAAWMSRTKAAPAGTTR